MGVEAAAVDAAYERLREVVAQTPLQPHQRLSARTGAEVWLKREDLQVVRSYKLRGAYNLLAQLDREQRDRTVVCASAGNHAQGVAFACRALDLRAQIFLPRTTPRQKRARISLLGGDRVETIVGGDTYDAAFAAAREQAERTGALMVPAFDHPEIIAGQGTVAREIVEQLGRAPDVVVVPVGGGGLIAGITTWLAKHHPATRVVGVEPAGAASMAAAVAAGGPVELAQLDGFVDGAAVRKVGAHTYGVLEGRPVDLREVDPGVLCEEMLELFDVDGVIAEPAGALAPAALRAEGLVRPGETVVAVVSGGNHDVSRYAEVMERALVSRGVKHYFLVEFPQEPGALRRFLDEVLGPDDDITLFEYVKRTNREFGPALVGIELGSPADLAPLLARLDASPITAQKLAPGDPVFRFLV
ncbi:threonine dehydratase [Amycolatopsis bartoniae]|uniref:L-threonine dehydratase n=1 Tax=Amycolatopsis bartoniae TaxID=941986 RepID=A0A8H9IVF6_9PSEU|nr:threonine ammonia-lyase IlvA [Amycolatopsis bartoniae]MBB2938970.1 threonine dehydratase [Amycolatopsis bartoniae]TVT11229.1 threonine ammonia-lyase IlvA [Amycolatopsis bartoniae]GHF65862.1 L-threonine dehydratase [Amycolatopsis bartoniae]